MSNWELYEIESAWVTVSGNIYVDKNNMRFVKQLWWRFMPGVTISIPWPKSDGVNPFSVDPNYAFRPWLKTNVGKQGWDWDWAISEYDFDLLTIKFRKKHANLATFVKLIWS